MDLLKKIWPGAFAVKKDDSKKFVITLIAYIVIGALCGFIAGFLGFIPVLGWILGIVASVVDLYCFIGLILSILVYAQILKLDGATEEKAEEKTEEASEAADEE